MASLREALAMLPGVDPDASEVDALEAIRSVWRRVPTTRSGRRASASPRGRASGRPSPGTTRRWRAARPGRPTFRAEAWRAVGAAFGIDDPGAPGGSGRPRSRRPSARGHPVIDGMHDVLAAVAARHPVGLITNGPSDIQRLKLEQSGLTGAFGAEVISGELGVGKPDPSVFHGLLDGLGAGPVGLGHGRGQLGARRPRRDCTPACRPCGSPTAARCRSTDPRVAVVDSVRRAARGPGPADADRAARGRRTSGVAAQPAIWRSM